MAGPPDLRDQLKKSRRQQVVGVIDGDTVILRDQSHLHLVGIQAPKIPLAGRKIKAAPFGPQSPFGLQSKAFLSHLVQGKFVTLYFGGQKKDRYGRLLAHLFLDDGRWVQGELLRKGLARVYTFSDNRAIVPEMLALEKQARQNKQGLWSRENYKVKKQENARKYLNSFQLITGTVKQVAKVRSRYYLNFGDDWRQDFTIVITAPAARKFIKAGLKPENFEGKKIEIRGWLKSYNGPMIEATHPEQIVIIK